MKLYFITSNRAKLANAKHICKDYDIAIVPHKKLFYGYGYQEPRIQFREQLLESSIESAIHRWEKYVHGQANDSFFFIEDTSVIISALSSENEEVPGVDVKYWMEDMTFKKIDRIAIGKGIENLTKCSDFHPRHPLSKCYRWLFVIFDVTLSIIFYFTLYLKQ